MGINSYPHVPQLKGCINDAQGIRDAVTPFASRLVTLFNADATRENFLSTWDGFVQDARAGDQILITYSGHGGTEPERVQGSKADGLDRTLIFYEFDPKVRPHNGQRVFDGEIGARLSAGSRKQVTTWLVADSCYSGGLTRNADPRANALTIRSHRYEVSDDMLANLAVPAVEPGAQSNVVFLAGAQENQVVPELMLGGQKHGALSYTFANEVKRAAADGDATIMDFVRKVVGGTRQLAEGQQHPRAIVRTNEQAPIFRAPNPGAAAPPPPRTETAVLRIFVAASPADRQHMIDVIQQLPDVRVVSGRDEAELVLDTDKGDLISTNGDLLASDLKLQTAFDADSKLKGAISKVGFIASLAGIPSGEIEIGLVSPKAELAAGSLNSQNQVHRIGERLDVVVRPLLSGDLVVLSVDAWGTIVILRPIGNEALRLPGAEWRLPVQVTGPRGAGHVVAIFAPQMPAALAEQLRHMEGQPGAAANPLVTAAVAGRVQLGVLGFFS